MSVVKIRSSHLAAIICGLLSIAGASCFSLSPIFRVPSAAETCIVQPAGSRNEPSASRELTAAGPVAYSAITESYDKIVENDFILVANRPLSTFSAAVDTAAYSNVRRFLNQGQLPPPDSIRIADMVNYFNYDYPNPEFGEHPVAIAPELNPCPWNKDNYLLRIGVQAKRIDPNRMPPRNFVFLIDVSGSMDEPNKLPLVKKSLELLVEQMREQDRIAIVTYAGNSGLALASTPGNKQSLIRKKIKKLEAGGSTNGGEGIKLAYKIAQENFKKSAINRVILATDGDFNVGVTDEKDLVKLIEAKRKSGVYLTVLGYGMGNLKDATLEKLAHHGNGHYAYIDSEREARKLFVEQGAALAVVAKDVKFQVEFNPAHVESYRLIGYENRLLKDKDFDNDKKDAGDLGSGHTCTALYELAPANRPRLKYQAAATAIAAASSPEWLTVKLRYKDADAETSKLMEVPVENRRLQPSKEPETADFRFAAAVAEFGMLLRDSPHKGEASLEQVRRLAQESKHPDLHGHRKEFLELVRKAEALKNGATARAQRE